MEADQRKLDAIEARIFFQKYAMKLKLTSTYNPKANDKSKRGHPSIINALVKTCKNKPK